MTTVNTNNLEQSPNGTNTAQPLWLESNIFLTKPKVERDVLPPPFSFVCVCRLLSSCFSSTL